MFSLSPLTSFVLTALALSSTASTVLGPVTNLHIVNRNISPDGYKRQAVLAEGTFPGPLIQANKVCLALYLVLKKRR